MKKKKQDKYRKKCKKENSMNDRYNKYNIFMSRKDFKHIIKERTHRYKKETGRMRGELESCRRRLEEAERAAAERAAAASAALSQHDEARDQVHHAHCQLQLLRERLENREARVAELELRATALETQQSAAEAALAAAVRRVRDLQEECSQHRTRAHQHHAAALQLQAELATHQEEIAALREASEAATAWWRTRETKADATLRQQAKLIDFLQAKVEEASRKKCSLSNKLFGRSGRRPFVSPPLRRANRELREEVDRLRAKLSTKTVPPTPPRPFPTTPKLDQTPKTTPQFSNLNRREKRLDVPDMPDNDNENELQVVWPNGSRERMQARCSDGVLVLSQGDKEYRAHFLTTEVNNLPQNEVNRAFTVSIEGNPAVVVCGSASSRAGWVSAAAPPAPAPAPAPAPYRPAPLAALDAKPRKALILSNNAVAIGCEDGLHSLRGPVSLETGSDPPQCASVTELAAAGGRVLCVRAGGLLQCGLLALGSALRRAPELRPTLTLDKVRLPDLAPPHLLRAVVGEVGENHSCVVVACGRRLFLLRWDAAAADFKICRSLTVDRPPASLLLTPTALYIAGEKPLRLNLPQGALETFAIDDPTIAAAAKKHSLPRTLLKIRHNPIEILICYNECGVFVDENGKRTRNEDPKWSSAVQGWEFVTPFLYLVGEEKITILYITDDAYKAPPCTCDTASVASTVSECYLPVKFNLKLKEPALIGVAPNGIVVRTKTDEGYSISIVNGMAAMKSVGASVESLDSVSDAKDSNTDLNQSLSDVTRSPSYDSPPSPPSPQDISQESVETNTGFLADIRKRAKQLRSKHRKDRSPEDVIKEILTTEVGLTRSSTGRKSPAIISECDSDSSDEQNGTESSNNKGTDDICAEMFTRQVRFQPFD